MTGTAPARVAIVGTGVIGAGWAALFLAHGCEVSAHDPAPGAEDRLRREVDRAWPALERLGLAPGATADRLTFVDHASDAVRGADFVQESGPEQTDLKQRLLAELDEATPSGVPIASSTSGIMPTDLQRMVARHPERILVGHPFSPAHLIPLVEVVPGAQTTPAVVEQAVTTYRSIGKRPVVLQQEVPGHLANRLQAALWREAYSLVERGVVTVAEVDTAISHGPGLRWALLGPLVGQHLAGGPGGMAHVLEHLGPPAQRWMDDLGAPTLNPGLVDKLVTGVDAELAGVDADRMVAARDELLITLLELKAGTTALP